MKKKAKNSKLTNLTNRGFYYLTFFVIFITAFVILSLFFLSILSAFPDRPRVKGLFKSIEILDIPVFKAFVITDVSPPVLSNGSPSGALAAGTISVNLSLVTDEDATCKYANISGIEYGLMPNIFSTTGGTSHSTLVSDLLNGQIYNYYVRCQDNAGNANTNDFIISFSISVVIENRSVLTPVSLGRHSIAESSGVIASRQYAGVYWMMGDSDQPAAVYAVNASGSTIRSFSVSGTSNRDWEDIALDESNRIWIAETGNNAQAAIEYRYYVFQEPNPFASGSILNVITYRFRFSDGEKDAEALFIWQGIPYVVQKRPANARVYRLATLDPVNVVTADFIGEFNNGGNWITGADISRDGRRLALINDNPDYHWVVERGISSTRIADFFTSPSRQWRIQFNNNQGEAISFVNGSYNFVVASETGDFWMILQSSYDSACGNGVVDSGEECDDGNLINGDGCASVCQIERLFKYEMSVNPDEWIIVNVTDPLTWQQALDDLNGARTLIVGGTVRAGNGGFNNLWSWHLDPASIVLSNSFIEICDSMPSGVENNLSQWLGKTYCPWSSKVVSVSFTPPLACIDNDGDGWNATAVGVCGAIADCDDSNVAINPGRSEACDGIDNNCVNGIDEGCFVSEFTFSAAGDHGWNANTNASLNALNTSGSLFYLALGDMSYASPGTETGWCNTVKARLNSTYPFELVSGNHEETGGPNGYIMNFAACLPDRMNSQGLYAAEYYFDVGNLARIIMISPDLNIGSIYNYFIGNSNYTWLSNTIDSARTAGIQWVFVGMHKNCITAATKNCEIGTDLMNLLLSKRVDLILQGHDHVYERSKQLSCAQINLYNVSCVVDDGSDGFYTKGEGSVLLIDGTFGQSLYNINTADSEAGYFASWMGLNINPTYGFTRFFVNSTTLLGQFVRSAGGTFNDTFRIVANISLPSCIDDDGDGWNATAVGVCGSLSDCDDGNATINPSAVEICNDNVDNNCNSLIDDNDSACTLPTESPSIAINFPLNSSTLSGGLFIVNYSKAGNQTDVNHTHLILDGVEYMDLDNDGAYGFSDIADGSHILRVFLVKVDHTQIGNDHNITFTISTPPITDTGTGGTTSGGGAPRPKPVAKNITNETILIPTIERIELLEGETSSVEIEKEGSILIDVYGNTYELSFVVTEDGIIVRAFNGDYLIPRDETLPVAFGNREVFIGIESFEEGNASIVMGLDEGIIKEQVEKGVKEESALNKIRKGAFYFIVILGSAIMLIVLIVIAIILMLKKKRSKKPSSY